MIPDQVKSGLDLLVQAVQAMGINPARVMCISPYGANIPVNNTMRRRQEYKLLQDMPEASTADSFQGQENDIVVVIMGTAHPRPGPSFTCKSRRLNAMLSRQRSALIVVGDINVAQNRSRYIIVDESTGATSWVVGETLNSVYGQMKKLKRVVTVPATRGNSG
ncbi:hypothetical protein ACHAP5_009242 [Fusarium lateritium]